MKKSKLIWGCICIGCVSITNPGYTFASDSIGNTIPEVVMGTLQTDAVSESEDGTISKIISTKENNMPSETEDILENKKDALSKDDPTDTKNISAEPISDAIPVTETSAQSFDFSTAPAKNIHTDIVPNGWCEESDGMHYYIDGNEIINRGIKIDGYWYYFTSNGNRLESNFRQKDTDWYYYDNEGRMVNNTEMDIAGLHYKFLNSGAAHKGWDITTNGTFYYTWDGSRAESKGIQINGYWYYFQENGKMLSNGWREKAGGYYYYDSNGHMATNKGLQIDGFWYYFTSSGKRLQSGFRQKGTDWYYYDDKGHMLNNIELDIDGLHYKFLNSGAAFKGWDNTTSGTFYYTEDGSRAAGKGLLIDGYWYYFQENGKMLSNGWREKAGGYYYYDSNGHMVANKGLQIDGFWYYFTSSGKRLQSDFRQKGTDWYYYDDNGRMLSNIELDINGLHCKFLNSGAAYIGWDVTSNGTFYYTKDGSRATDRGMQINGFWYYFQRNGKMLVNDWREKTGDFYYYDSNGHMTANKGLKIEGFWYYFTASGKMLTGWRQKGNDWYYYDGNGHMVSDCTIYIAGYKYCFTSSGKRLAGTWYNGEYYDQDGKQTTPPTGNSSYTVELPGDQTTTVFGRYDIAASQQVFNLLNQYRVQNGLYPLQPANSALQAAANIRAYELAYLFDHIRPNGQSCFSVYTNSSAENIATGWGTGGYQFDAYTAMNGWINSPGHNANMLNTFSSSVGIAVFTQTINGINYTYYVQLFSY